MKIELIIYLPNSGRPGTRTIIINNLDLFCGSGAQSEENHELITHKTKKAYRK